MSEETARRKEPYFVLYSRLGGACADCGEKDWRVFHIDHIYNDGKKWREGLARLAGYSNPVMGNAYARLLITLIDIKVILATHQILCANCHHRKSCPSTPETEKLAREYL